MCIRDSYLDMFQWLGGMPVTVTGHVSALMHDIEVEDSASALLEYPNGANGFIHCTTVQAPSQTRLELWGEIGGVVVTDEKVVHFKSEIGLREFSATEKDNPFAKLEITDGPLLDNSTGGSTPLPISPANHQDAVSDFAQAILEGREPSAPGEEGVKGLELAASIIYSGCIGEKVNLPIDRLEYDTLLGELQGGRQLPVLS